MKTPQYGRKKADEIIGIISHLAEETSSDTSIIKVQINLSADNLLILADMLYEMDRHLPDFFEAEEEPEEAG